MVKSAERVLDILEMLNDAQEPLGLAAVATALGLPRSSALALMRTLVRRGYVEQDGQGRYSLGHLPGEGGPFASLPRLVRIARPHVERGVARCRETGFLAMLGDNLKIRYVLKVLTEDEIRYDRDISVERDAYLTASGLALLAFSPAERVERYLAGITIRQATETSVKDAEDLRRRLDEVRRDGFAMNFDGRFTGASGVAAPVLGPNGLPVCAVNVAGPTERFRARLPEVIEAAREAAANIAGDLAGLARTRTTRK